MGKDGDVTTLAMDGSELDEHLVARLDRDIRARGVELGASAQGRSSPRFIVDCSKIEALTPEGLCALIELGSRLSGVWQVALAALPRVFLRHAIEVGLAERFSIYASVAAAERALGELEG
jgi:hypothetical protein